MEENITSKNKEKSEVFNTFFVSVFNSQTGYSRILSPQYWKIGKESRINLP